MLAALGSIDYWFVTEGRRVHKTVHHYLLRFSGGELSDEDIEVTEVAWVPLHDLPARLAYADERRLAEVAGELIRKLQSDGPGALPPLPRTAPRRRPQTHSHTRNHRSDEAEPRPAGRTVAVRRRDARAALVAAVPRAAAVIVADRAFLLPAPHCRAAAAASPARRTFLTVRIDSVTPDLVTTASDPVVTVTGTVTNVGDRPVRDIVARLEHAAAVTSSARTAHRSRRGTSTSIKPVARVHQRVARDCERGQTRRVHLGLSAAIGDRAVAGHRPARDLPAAGQRQRHPRLRRTGPARRRALPAAGPRACPRRPGRRARTPQPASSPRTPRKPVRITMLWPLADKPRLAPGRARRHHPGAADGRRPRDLAGRRRPPRHAAGARPSSPPARRWTPTAQ